MFIAAIAVLVLALGGAGYWLLTSRSGTPVAAPTLTMTTTAAGTTGPPATTTSRASTSAPKHSPTPQPSTQAPTGDPDPTELPALTAEQAATLARSPALVGPLAMSKVTVPPLSDQVPDPACVAYDLFTDLYLQDTWSGKSGTVQVTFRVFDSPDTAMQAHDALDPCVEAAIRAGVTDTKALDQGVVGLTHWWTSRSAAQASATLTCIYGNVAMTRIVSGSTPPPTSLCETFADEVEAAAQ